LLEPRRVGKTSVALAALGHCRSEHQAVTMHLDLADSARTPGQVVSRIAEQAAGQNVGKATARLRRRRCLGSANSALNDPGVEAASQLLGIEDLDQVMSTVAAILSPGEHESDVGAVLKALEADAHVSNRPLVVFVDEVQALAAWGEPGDILQQQLASSLRRASGKMTFVFAGSERHAVKKLFAEGQPLYYAGLDFDLDEISTEDWREGLTRRFAEGGYQISGELLDDVLEASDGHPLRTMQVCAHVYEWAQDGVGAVISGAAVLRGIASAQHHPSWKDADA
jgi:hypothetical protein